MPEGLIRTEKGLPGARRLVEWDPDQLGNRAMPLYFVVLFDTCALVGRIPPGPDSVRRVEACVAEYPEWDDEYQRGWSHGDREVLKRQFPWLADETLDKCDKIPARQQLVYFEEGE